MNDGGHSIAPYPEVGRPIVNYMNLLGYFKEGAAPSVAAFCGLTRSLRKSSFRNRSGRMCWFLDCFHANGRWLSLKFQPVRPRILDGSAPPLPPLPICIRRKLGRPGRAYTAASSGARSPRARSGDTGLTGPVAAACGPGVALVRPRCWRSVACDSECTADPGIGTSRTDLSLGT